MAKHFDSLWVFAWARKELFDVCWAVAVLQMDGSISLNYAGFCLDGGFPVAYTAAFWVQRGLDRGQTNFFGIDLFSIKDSNCNCII